MLIALKYYQDFILLLNKNQVQYILVGGAAGRLKDLADIDELKKVHAVETGHSVEVKKENILKRFIKRLFEK